MTSVEEHYRQQDTQKKAADEAKAIASYNETLRVIREITEQILPQLLADPPKECMWVTLNGERRVAWKLFATYASEYVMGLMPDGRIVCVEKNGPTQIVSLAPTSTYANIKDLYGEVGQLAVSLGSNCIYDYGITPPPGWEHRTLS
jgi:hypothetical protein